jgi:sulfatase maturation enzyme AslB (radical SAM superfamily)
MGCEALCGAVPHCGASACVSVPTTSVPILESGGAHASYCNKDCEYCHATRRKLNLETAYHAQRELSRMRANPACVSKSA